MSTASNNSVASVLSVTGSSLGTAQTSAVQSNPYGRGIKLQISVPTYGSGSFTVSIQGVINGVAYTILTSAAINASGTTILSVYPGLTASANVTGNDVLPPQWQVVLTPTTFTGVVNIAAAVIV